MDIYVTILCARLCRTVWIINAFCWVYFITEIGNGCFLFTSPNPLLSLMGVWGLSVSCKFDAGGGGGELQREREGGGGLLTFKLNASRLSSQPLIFGTWSMKSFCVQVPCSTISLKVREYCMWICDNIGTVNTGITVCCLLFWLRRKRGRRGRLT